MDFASWACDEGTLKEIGIFTDPPLVAVESEVAFF